MLRQSLHKPQVQVLHQYANYLISELRRSPEAVALPIQSAEDGSFAIAALIDEFAMQRDDLRPYWSQQPLQASQFMTNNAGVEVFQRLQRVRKGPPVIVATYAAVLGLGFQGCYGLPGADRYQLAQLRRDLGIQLGVDPDRDWRGGVLQAVRAEDVASLDAFKEPWHRSLWVGRALPAILLIGAILTLLLFLV